MKRYFQLLAINKYMNQLMDSEQLANINIAKNRKCIPTFVQQIPF